MVNELYDLEELAAGTKSKKGRRTRRINTFRTFNSSRNERAEKKGRIIEDGKDYSKGAKHPGPMSSAIVSRDINREFYPEKPINPYIDGTNAYYQTLGFGNDIVTQAVILYGKDTVKVAGRMAYDYLQLIEDSHKDEPNKPKGKSIVNHLLSSISSLGEDATEHLVFNEGLDPQQISGTFNIHNSRNFKIATPKGANVTLELIASSADITTRLMSIGLVPVYTGEKTRVYGFNPK